MNKYIKFILFAVLTTLSLSGCYRDELTFPRHGVVELNIDWSRSAVKANSATVVIYKDGQYYSTEIVSQYPPVRKLLSLPAGRFDFIVHNENNYDLDKSMKFLGLESFDTFEVEPIDVPLRSATIILKESVDTLAVARHVGLEITKDMIYNYETVKSTGDMEQRIAKSITVQPKQSFMAVSVVANVKNGNGYYFAKNNPPSIKATSMGYLLGKDSYLSDVASHIMTLAPVPQSKTNSTLIYSGDLLTVGVPGRVAEIEGWNLNDNYIITLPFVSITGIEYREINLQNEATKFKFTPENPKDPNNNYDKLEIELDIELPKLSQIGDLEVGMDDWNDVDIPLDGPQRLNFIANNGTTAVYWQLNIAGNFINMPRADIFEAPSGYKFKYWNETADGKGKAYLAGDQYLMVRGSKNFYAIWEKK